VYTTTYNTLRDTFSVKVSEEIDVVEILRHSTMSSEVRLIKHTLEEERPIDARTLSGIWLSDWSAVRSSVSDHGRQKERSQGQELLSTSSL
jgi:hypothetical protein